MSKLDEVIARLEQLPKLGESYDHFGRHGNANPIRSDTGPLLTLLVRLFNPKSILEIGTAQGLSLCHIAKGAPTAKLTTIEWDGKRAQEAIANFEEAGIKATVLQNDAMKVMDTLKGPFDLVFLDGNKDGYYEQMVKLRANDLLALKCWVVDRNKDCKDFIAYMQDNFPNIVLPTECGLFIGQI